MYKPTYNTLLQLLHLVSIFEAAFSEFNNSAASSKVSLGLLAGNFCAMWGSSGMVRAPPQPTNLL